MKTPTKLRTRKNIPYTILPVRSFAVSYSKTQKSQLKYESKYDPYKIAQFFFKPKYLKFGHLKFFLKT